MSFGDAIQSFYKNFNEFSGRSSRSEYWWAYLFVALLYIPVVIFGNLIDYFLPWQSGSESLGSTLVTMAYVVIHILPFCALLVRRLHDTGRSGWFALLNFVPFGGIAVFIFTLLKSDAGQNRYSPNPSGPQDYPPMNVQAATGGFCSSCGNELRGNSGFCGDCGTSTSRQ
jgi:uncharacterized membrane protein YhaH (DUF805 family)